MKCLLNQRQQKIHIKEIGITKVVILPFNILASLVVLLIIRFLIAHVGR
jgi:hypothetical protein